MTSPHPTSWYATGLRFACTGCGACCTGEPGLVRVRERDIARIADFLARRPAEIRRAFLRREPEGWSARERTNGACAFLRGSACRIYPVRPVQCRTFPFWPGILRSPGAWKEAGRACPGIDRGRTWDERAILQQVHRELDARREWRAGQ